MPSFFKVIFKENWKIATLGQTDKTRVERVVATLRYLFLRLIQENKCQQLETYQFPFVIGKKNT